jgi:hypothetical protein
MYTCISSQNPRIFIFTLTKTTKILRHSSAVTGGIWPTCYRDKIQCTAATPACALISYFFILEFKNDDIYPITILNIINVLENDIEQFLIRLTFHKLTLQKYIKFSTEVKLRYINQCCPSNWRGLVLWLIFRWSIQLLKSYYYLQICPY